MSQTLESIYPVCVRLFQSLPEIDVMTLSDREVFLVSIAAYCLRELQPLIDASTQLRPDDKYMWWFLASTPPLFYAAVENEMMCQRLIPPQITNITDVTMTLETYPIHPVFEVTDPVIINNVRVSPACRLHHTPTHHQLRTTHVVTTPGNISNLPRLYSAWTPLVDIIMAEPNCVIAGGFANSIAMSTYNRVSIEHGVYWHEHMSRLLSVLGSVHPNLRCHGIDSKRQLYARLRGFEGGACIETVDGEEYIKVPVIADDVDIFVFGEDCIGTATRLVHQLLTTAKASSMIVTSYSSAHAFTLQMESAEGRMRFQIIKRTHSCKDDIIMGFDLPSAQVLLHQGRLYATPLYLTVVKYGCNIIFPHRKGVSYNDRLRKYILRGYWPHIPILVRSCPAKVFEHTLPHLIAKCNAVYDAHDRRTDYGSYLDIGQNLTGMLTPSFGEHKTMMEARRKCIEEQTLLPLMQDLLYVVNTYGCDENLTLLQVGWITPSSRIMGTFNPNTANYFGLNDVPGFFVMTQTYLGTNMTQTLAEFYPTVLAEIINEYADTSYDVYMRITLSLPQYPH